MHPRIHCGVIYNSQDLEAIQVPITRRGGKKAVVHLHNGILLSCKTEGNFTFCNSMAGPTGMLNETGQSEKDKYHMISLTCGI